MARGPTPRRRLPLDGTRRSCGKGGSPRAARPLKSARGRATVRWHGLAPAAPGHRRLRIAPLPGRGITQAGARLHTPYGTAEVSWALSGRELTDRVPESAARALTLWGLEWLDEKGTGPRSDSRAAGALGGPVRSWSAH
ncbi:alpha-L-rhamnosidase C-terminal domain-containing protein [Streptomyces lincolnensis]|uniref:alpha-L-rhamnosidase C-terminal domain-containing protein n=1 Tax=Streptomyces lincolnensis TaxID=1915 RepID=UPI0037CF3EE1